MNMEGGQHGRLILACQVINNTFYIQLCVSESQLTLQSLFIFIFISHLYNVLIRLQINLY